MTTPLDLTVPAAIGRVAPPGLDDAGATAQRQLVLAAARAMHWQRTRRLTTILLLAWLATTFGSVFFARELAGLTLFGWPLSFYLAAQGAALIYLTILGVYAFAMRRFDADFHYQSAAGGAVTAAAAAPAAGSGKGLP